jgi:hypothetical protein
MQRAGFAAEPDGPSIATLTACKIALLSRDDIADITKYDARLTRVLWWATLVDEAILREWIVTSGVAQQRSGWRISFAKCCCACALSGSPVMMGTICPYAGRACGRDENLGGSREPGYPGD